MNTIKAEIGNISENKTISCSFKFDEYTVYFNNIEYDEAGNFRRCSKGVVRKTDSIDLNPVASLCVQKIGVHSDKTINISVPSDNAQYFIDNIMNIVKMMETKEFMEQDEVVEE